jgi:catechol 2,3-dioxygenase-like lactoylglutathione lyase family enzyme
MRKSVFVATCALTMLYGSAAAQPDSTATVRPYLWSSTRPPSEVGEINVFRRFDARLAAAMREFYGELLALPVLGDTALGGGQMIRYPIGGSEVKLFPVAESPAAGGDLDAVYGVRLLTFFYDDEAAIIERFAARGLAAPRLAATARPGATAAALAQDPAGQWVELVIEPGATAARLARFEIGLNVADLEASRAFYGKLLGLAEQTPLRDPLVGATRHLFTHGAVTINLWSSGAGLATDAQTAGIQYIVWNVPAIDEIVRARGARIDRPLSAPAPMRTLWLLDPDGVSNYFAQFSGNDNRAEARRERAAQ